jgi:hypothetical protein
MKAKKTALPFRSTLKNDGPLFQKLKTENPTWWQFIKENIKPGGFYVDIRKDNSLNVYYNGGSLFKITISRGKINCKIHEYYLGKPGSKYIRYEDPDRLPIDVDNIKEKIESRYSNTSENGIKAKLICDPNAKYIDSEFAHQNTRIDLTKLENGKIVFVELKRIQDGRLSSRDVPEILSQMEAYRQFIKDNEQEITDYYKTLFTIKHDLGILPQSMINITNIDDYKLGEDVELYIAYADLNDLNQKRKRIKDIKTNLDNNNIIHNLNL